MEVVDGATEVLHSDVLRGQNLVDLILVVYRERRGANHASNHLLDREACNLCPAGVCPVDWCSINWCTLIFGPHTGVINKIYKPISLCTNVALASIA